MSDTPTPQTNRQSPRIGRWVWLIMLVWMAMVYNGALRAGFLLDDEVTILLDEPVTHLGVCLKYALIQDRGLVRLTFAINYALDGFEPWGYHLFNLAVHYLNGLLLYALLSRIFQRPRVGMDQSRATWLALAGALIWLIHPFGSQAVIYLSQRAELMASTAYLASAYGLVRSADTPTQSRRWQVLAVLSCLLGMSCKLICITIPLTLLAMDWLVIASSFREIWQRRRWMYMGLFATWGMLIVTGMLSELGNSSQDTTAGAGLVGIISPSLYLAAQSGVILHYLKLAIWPSTLVFDYAWPVPTSLWDCATTLIIMVLLFLATVGLVARKVRWSFLPLSVFLILAPTSSFVPVMDLAVEHRMYLALASVCVGVLILLWKLLSNHPRVMMGVCVMLILVLSVRTWVRVGDYENTVTLWQSVLDAYPQSARAKYQYDLARVMHQGLGKQIRQLQQAIAHDDQDAASRHALGTIYLQIQKLKRARPLLEKALELEPNNPAYQLSMAKLDRIDGRLERAQELYQQMLTHDPNNVSVLVNYAELLAGLQQWDEALSNLDHAISLNPDDVSLLINRANILLRAERFQEALVAAQQAYDRSINKDATYSVLASAYAANGKWAQALELFEKMLNAYPDHAGTMQRLAWLYATCPDAKLCDGKKALMHARAFFNAVGGSSPTAWDTLAAAWARDGQYEQAITAMHKAITRLHDVKRDDLIPSFRERLEQYQQHQPWQQDAHGSR